MSKIMRMLNVVAVTLAVSGAAHAQTTIINTIGTGTSWGLGNNVTVGQFIGIDPGNPSPNTPNTPAMAGYGAQPFAVTALPGNAAHKVTSLDIVLNARSTTNSSPSNLDRLFGAFFIPGNDPNTGQRSLAASTQVGDFFRFDTSAVNNLIDPGEGDNTVRIFSAINPAAANVILEPGQEYLFVVAPTDSLDAPNNLPLFMYGLWQSRAQVQITMPANMGMVDTPFVDLQSAQFERGGAQPGVSLSTAPNTYFGLRVVAAVPEPSALATLLCGGLMLGGLLAARRRVRK